MFLDDDSRRSMYHADLDHRRDRLHLMRRQQRRTRAAFEGLRASEASRVCTATGVAPEDGAFESIVARVRRYRLAASVHIDALAGLSGEMRGEMRARFDAIDPWRPAADVALLRLETDLARHTAELDANADGDPAPCCRALLAALALLRAACSRYPAVI
jgi:hypothetical protein